MPVIVLKDKEEDWLNPKVELEALLGRLQAPLPEEGLTAYPISTRVNSPKAEGPELIVPIGEALGPFS
jgi:putative SOS response-associated peptidase YedK